MSANLEDAIAMMSLFEKSKKTFQQLKKWQQFELLAGIVFILVVALACLFDAPGVRQCITGFDVGKCFLFKRSLWDWLELLIVPLALVLLGYFLQQREQQRAERDRKEEQDRREEEAKEEVLQAYFDRLSSLLVEQNLLAIAAKLYPPKDKFNQVQQAPTNKVNPTNAVSPAEKEKFDAGLDVIRAHTLSILRRFKDDPERKASVIRFLAEAEVLSKARLNLSGAILSDAILFSADLSGAILGDADLSNADLFSAFLRKANLRGANLNHANLSGAILSGAVFRWASLSNADLFNTNLSKANLSSADLSHANLSHAYLFKATLRKANLSHANLFGADLSSADLSSANLSNVYLGGTRYNRFTKFPDGFDLTANELEFVG